MDISSEWVVLLATVSVEGLIDVCQPSSERLPEANWATFLWDLYGSCTEGLQKSASLPTLSRASQNIDRLSWLCRAQIRSCFSGKLSLSAGIGLQCEPASRYLQRKNEAANY